MRILAAVAVLLLAQPGADMPKKARQHPRATAYGQGINALIQDAQTLPTAYNLAVQASGDADNWWAGQGSPTPTPATIQAQAPPGQGALAYGYYGQPTVLVSPSYLNDLNQRLMHYSGTAQGERALLAQLWTMMTHERGHNLGYGHDRGGIMDPDLGASGMPGQAYTWAATLVPSRKRKKIRRG